MSLITTCPQCLTTFRVSKEQLATSQGKVRCGKCQHVFDALSRLGEVPALKVEKPVAPPPPVTQPPRLVPDTAPKAKLASRRSKPKMPRWLLVLLAVILLLGAISQTLYYLRTPIAAHWPMLRPHLVAACEVLQCTIGLPRHAELLTIDDSDMQEDAERAGVIHLSATLINNAPFTQAYPLLELTLTDAYDKPMIRRALTAAEYLPGQDTSQGILPGESVQIRLALTAGEATVAGYRVFVTYSASNENH
jgi:predicted Zn finger-like uncharacterized protein